MISASELLHELAWKARRYHYEPLWEIELPKQSESGIYLIFEDGESCYGGDRIVHVGTHSGNNNLMNRLKEHYVTENHHRSIFRKHIGRAILNKRSDSYLAVWNIDYTYTKNKELYSSLRNLEVEAQIEQEVSQYLRQHTSFCIISERNKNLRKDVEAGLIALLAQDKRCAPSSSWLGLWATDLRIQESGLWNIQGLSNTPLTSDEVLALSNQFVFE